MKLILILLLLTPPVLFASDIANNIKFIIAKQLNLNPKVIHENMTIDQLGGDALDLVELIMQVEDSLGVIIDDNSLITNGKNINISEFPKSLTVSRLIYVAKISPQAKLEKRTTQDKSDIIQEGEVGIFGDLIKKNNPNNYNLVFIPSLFEIIKLNESKLGRKLTAQESRNIKNSCAVIALPQEVAKEFKNRARN